MLISRNCMPIS